MAKSTFTLEWQAPEHEHKERSSDWFWVAGIIVGALTLVSIIFGNIILAILLVVSAFSLSLFINRKPEDIKILIDDAGIRKENILYPIDTLASFWIDLDHPHKKILLRSKKPLMPLVVIPLSENVDVEGVREFLLDKVQEEPLSLPLVEKVLEYLGF